MTAPSHTRIDLPPVEELVAGAWHAPADRLDLVVEDPYAGTALASAPASGPDAIEAALTAAQVVHETEGWISIPVARRAEILDEIGTALEAEVPRIAALEAFATGVPVTQTSIVGVIVPGAFHLAAEMLRSGVLAQTQDGPTGTPGRGAPAARSGRPCAWCRGTPRHRWRRTRSRRPWPPERRRSSSRASSRRTAPPSSPGWSTAS